jgi:tetratricopeptide (TPR) repeat protein
MKLAVRALLFSCLILSALAAVLAESRGKELKLANREIRKGNFGEAEKIYRRLIARNSEDKEARLGLSFALIKQIRLQEAYEEAAQVVAVDVLNSRALALLGTALLRSGEFRNSVESFQTALKFNDREALALAGLSEVAYYENRSRLAYEGIKRAILIDPQEPDYYILLARICSRLELYREAADAYQQFLEVAPKTDEERRARIRGLIDFYRYLGTTKLHRLSGEELSQIPFELRGNRPFINIKVNDKGPLRFVIDTGASLSVISDKVAERLGIRPVARGGNARAVGGTGSFPIIYGLLNSITIGEIKIEMVPVYIRTVHGTSDTPENERADGYLGLSVLSNFLVIIDYQAATLTLDRTTPRNELEAVRNTAPVGAEPPQVAIPIRSTSGGLASAEAHLPNASRPLNFIIDTGASATVVSKNAVKRHNLEGLKLEGMRFRVIGAAGVEEGVEAIGLSTLTVNGLRQSNARALILDLDAVNEASGFEQHGIIGGDFLRHFRVELDLRRFWLHLTPQSPQIKVATEIQ